MRRSSIEVRYSSDGSISSRHYYYENRDYGVDLDGLELGGRASLDMDQEEPGWSGKQSLPWVESTPEEFIATRCAQALGTIRNRGGKYPIEWGEHPQRVLSIDRYPDGSLVTSSYWLGERTYEMEHLWTGHTERPENPMCREDSVESIRYRCEHIRTRGWLYMEPGDLITVLGPIVRSTGRS